MGRFRFIIAGLVLSTFAAMAAEFERLEFAMPERCDRALAVDVDADGDVDLVGVCRQEVVAVRLPEGKTVKLLEREKGSMIHGASWDADGDGDRDIAICCFAKDGGPAIFWLENPGWKVHSLDDEVDGVHGLASGDLNGDGRDDLVAACISGIRPLSVSWYDGKTETRRFLDESEAGSRPHYLAVADLNDDGANDVVLGAGDRIAWYAGPNWTREEIAEKPGATNVAVADMDGDERLDVVAGCGHGIGISWFSHQTWQEQSIDSELTDVHALDVGDLDGDGDVDVAAGSFGGYGPDKVRKQKLFWYENDGTGNLRRHDLDVAHGQESYSLEIIDVDSDGLNDIIIGGRGSENLVWYRQVSSGAKKAEVK